MNDKTKLTNADMAAEKNERELMRIKDCYHDQKRKRRQKQCRNRRPAKGINNIGIKIAPNWILRPKKEVVK